MILHKLTCSSSSRDVLLCDLLFAAIKIVEFMIGVLSPIVTWCYIAGFRSTYQRITSQLEVFKYNAPFVIGSLKSIVCVRVCVWIAVTCITRIMAAVSTTAKIPSPLNLSDGWHQGENWKSFRRERKFYELAAGIHNKAQKFRWLLMSNKIFTSEQQLTAPSIFDTMI